MTVRVISDLSTTNVNDQRYHTADDDFDDFQAAPVPQPAKPPTSLMDMPNATSRPQPAPAMQPHAQPIQAMYGAPISSRPMDRDSHMSDVSDKPGGLRGSSKIRAHRPRPIDAIKVHAGPSRTTTVNVPFTLCSVMRFSSPVPLLSSPICSVLLEISDETHCLICFSRSFLSRLLLSVLCVALLCSPLSLAGSSSVVAEACHSGLILVGSSIRGAARPTAVGRIRRNAISASSRSNTPPLNSTSTTSTTIWREFVKQRWNPEARFLNLEVRWWWRVMGMRLGVEDGR